VGPEKLAELLDEVAAGRLEPGQALERLKNLPYEDLGFARVDHHRRLRRGWPEVVFGQGKDAGQIAAIAAAIKQSGAAVLELMPEMEHSPQARCLYLEAQEKPPAGRQGVAVLAAGTSDLMVAEEAALTASLMGSRVERVFDVGVSGLHRLAAAREVLGGVRAVVVAAGMEGALPSVVAGMTDKPVVAVPTSVGYGAAFGGLAALLGMLNSCAPGLSVVNIDNGFGAGYLAAVMDHI